jgi:hypothetical protein
MGATLEGRVSNVWYEDSANDNNRYSIGLDLFRSISQASRAYVHGEYEDVTFDDDASAPDFDRTDALVGYTNHGARTSLSAEGGYTVVNFDDGEKQDGPLARLNLRRELSASTNIGLRLGYEFNDAARDIRQQGELGENAEGVISTGDVYQDASGGVDLTFSKHRTGIGLGIEYHDQDYVQVDELDRDRLRIYARLSRQLGRPFTASLNAEWESVDYVLDENFDYDETEYGAGLTWHAGRTLDFDLRYRYYTRPRSSFDTFDENRIWLRAEWSPGRH